MLMLHPGNGRSPTKLTRLFPSSRIINTPGDPWDMAGRVWRSSGMPVVTGSWSSVYKGVALAPGSDKETVR